LDPEPSFTFLATIDTKLLFGFIAIFVLLFCSALISAAEVAYFSLTPKDLDECSRSNPSKAAIITLLIENLKNYLQHCSLLIIL